MFRNRLAIALLAAAVATVSVPRAAAVDGVVEIHPACIAAGCFPGDGPGFPVEITQPGSYRLTGNLQVPDENTTAILVQADDVSIDLNGFVIQGVTTCTFDESSTTVTCAPLGPGDGIAVAGGGFDTTGTTVRNGTVRGMGDRGIDLGTFSRVEALAAESNGFIAVSLLSGQVTGVHARVNGGVGIVANGAGFSVVVDACIVERNGTKPGPGSGSPGLSLVSGTVTGSSVFRNAGSGVVCGGSCTVTGNTIASNDHGIRMTSAGTVRGNVVSGNRRFGLAAFQAPVGYAENSFRFNNGGNANPQVSGGIEIGANVCGDDAVCP